MRRLLSLALLLLAGCGDDAVPATGTVRGVASTDALWVMTYNVNFERPSEDTVTAIEEADADLVFLQETHAQWEQAIRARLSERYPHVLFRHAADEGGMAILSRHPITEQRHELARGGAFPAWRVTADTPIGELDILHVHLHPPLDEDGGLVVGYFTTSDARTQELMHHLRGAPPDLVLGDFNEGEGPAVSRLEAFGMRQAQAAWPPLELTWRWDTGTTELVGRPDHVFVAPRLRVAAVQVMQRGGSDHRPLRVAIEATR